MSLGGSQSEEGGGRLSLSLQSHRRQGFHFLSEALHCEEKHRNKKQGLPSTDADDADGRLVVALYRLGIGELDRALELCKAAEDDDDEAAAAATRSELESGRRNALERVAEIHSEMLVAEAAEMRLQEPKKRDLEVKASSATRRPAPSTGSSPSARRPPFASPLPQGNLARRRPATSGSPAASPRSTTATGSPARSKGSSGPPQRSLNSASRPQPRPQSRPQPSSSLLPSSPSGSRTCSSRSAGAPVRGSRSQQQEQVRHRSRGRPAPHDDSEVGNAGTLARFEEQVKEDMLVVKTKKGGVTALDDVVGHPKAKAAIRESVVLPAIRPELFSGLLSPPRGLLLFGPPGNGKTMLARALAGETGCRAFFNVTAASLTSRYVGEGEKMVKALFDTARKEAPSIVFIDEVDSLLSSRRSDEHSADRRIKTEFFSSVDGVLTDAAAGDVIVVGATNRPGELDDAALRRFTKRIYVPMPDFDSRKQLLSKLLSEHGSPLTASEVARVATATSGYSGSDLANLARDAAFGPIREIPSSRLADVRKEDIRRVGIKDFESAIGRIRASVDAATLAGFEEWNKKFGDVS